MEVGRVREGDALVFFLEGLFGCGAVDEGDTHLIGQACGEGIDEEGVEERGVFYIGDVGQVNFCGRAEDGSSLQHPFAVVHLEDAEAVERESMREGVLLIDGITCRREGRVFGSKGPAVRAKDFASDGVIMHIA